MKRRLKMKVGDLSGRKIDWLGFGIHTSRQKRQIGVQCILEVFSSEMG